MPVPVIDPDTGRINPDVPAEMVSATSSPAEDYLLPAREDTAHPGLVPGLYTVTLTAPGYEPGTVNVQVGQGQVAPAPLATLVPLGMITGRLTTRAGQLTGVTCIVATPSGIPPTTVQTSCTTPDDATCVLTDADPAGPLRPGQPGRQLPGPRADHTAATPWPCWSPIRSTSPPHRSTCSWSWAATPATTRCSTGSGRSRSGCSRPI